MSNFINYVKKYLEKPGHTLETLHQDYGIDSRETDNGLVIFSYSQIDSPKADPLVRMCRGLVLNKNNWEIVNYPFYRFYNFEEVPTERVKFNWNKAVATTKIDGSLLSVFWDSANLEWQIATRSCIGGTNRVNNFDLTFKDLFEEAIKPFRKDEFFQTLDKKYCYIFELVSPYNIIVTPYTETKLYCIGGRLIDENEQYREISFNDVLKVHPQWDNIILKPKVIPLYNDVEGFIGFEKMKALAEGVGSRDEGFVVVDYTSIDPVSSSFPRVKVKNSAYVALHHLRGTLETNEINFAEVLSIVYKGEQDEVIAALPQYTKIFVDVNIKWNNFCQEWNRVVSLDKFDQFWEMSIEERAKPENKKNFALKVQESDSKKFASFLFLMFNKNLTSLKQCLEFDAKKNIKDVLKSVWENFIKTL